MEREGTVVAPTILDAIDVAVIVHDPDTGEVLDVNTTAEQMYGYTAAEFRQLDVEEYSANSPEYSQTRAERLIAAAADGEPQSFEWHIKRSNGELLWFWVHLERTTIEGEPCVLATQRDITTYKERERRLRLLYRVLRHNLRNEMNLITGYSEQLVDAVDDDDVTEQIRIINETATNVASLSKSVSELEEITKYDATTRTPTEVTEFVERVLTPIRERFPHADITLDSEEEIWTRTDQSLQTALRHALENAIEHSDRDRPTVSIRVNEGVVENQVQIRIADDGPGLPDIELDILRDEEKATNVSHGSGLGLWIMKWCIESLGGELLFSSNEPRGTVVNVYLPSIESSADGVRRQNDH